MIKGNPPVRAPEPEAVSLRTLAAMIDISERSAERLRSSGRLGVPPITIGSRVRYPLNGPRGVRAWIAAGCPGRDEWEANKGATR